MAVLCKTIEIREGRRVGIFLDPVMSPPLSHDAPLFRLNVYAIGQILVLSWSKQKGCEIFKEVKEKQEATDKAFEEQQQQLEILDQNYLDKKVSKSRSRKPLGPVLGSTVRVVSGPFLDFSGTIKKLDRKRGLVTVGFTLFGKDTLAELDVSEIVEEKK